MYATQENQNEEREKKKQRKNNAEKKYMDKTMIRCYDLDSCEKVKLHSQQRYILTGRYDEVKRKRRKRYNFNSGEKVFDAKYSLSRVTTMRR